ncbi:MAG: hypothetical protein JWQ59_1899, partial [Cryobacterium sp.]|nr:hypothetical protein [Cryobacterium sp.]
MSVGARKVRGMKEHPKRYDELLDVVDAAHRDLAAAAARQAMAI